MDNDLIAFLRARLDKEEQAAYMLCGTEWVAAGSEVYVRAEPMPSEPAAWARDERMPPWIAAHDPRRAQREVEAKRAILAEHRHAATNLASGNPSGADFGCSICAYHDEYGQMGLGWCKTVRLLAAVWSDHPDYRAEWKL